MSRSSIYRLVRQKRCPPPVVIGGGRVRWRAGEIEHWLQGLPIQTYI
nr:AlpA family phage regulatory protein [Komagataeibacter europaeus]